MTAQNYSSEDAFQRWRKTGLRQHLDYINAAYRSHRFAIKPANDIHPSHSRMARVHNWVTVKFGTVTWGVFARAFWPIYQKGKSPLFFGSVVLSFDRDDEDAPSLFEIAQEIRIIRDHDVPLDKIESFAGIIRDDYAMVPRLEVPERIATKSGIYLQSIGMERAKLPTGYLHHRLVPIITHRSVPYATVVDHKFWSPEFKEIWLSGNPLLSAEELKEMQQHFPDVIS